MFALHFTPQEATQRLPLVKRIVEDIIDKGRLFRAFVLEYEDLPLPPEAEKMRDDIQHLLIELEELGCFFKDWDFKQGLVDFPSYIDGQEVLLSWSPREEKVCFYHGLDDACDVRIRIPEEAFDSPQLA